ncbi:hypothetical protein K435DRAFT_695700 [Dendrothele bispora CBS 962.96]|uniref:hAT-like transposase RNase-H fold domain-containing protein n=1 Tax=Dendrothele bispora (strain CBS 962.96) TaxID=1314807 RepID=A0A4S8KXX5_DENBC|nr:hypothetical protein K435DRAFT_695700 [Dendrothele bispora CBS 962.96]
MLLLNFIAQWFKIATARVSASSRPLLHTVIPLIDTLTDGLLQICKDWSKSSLTRAAAAKSIALLNKYYSKTDDSLMYRVAMVMHPLYRLKYFRDANWEQDWIKTAEDTTRKFFEEHYLCNVEVDLAPAPSRAMGVCLSCTICFAFD